MKARLFTLILALICCFSMLFMLAACDEETTAQTKEETPTEDAGKPEDGTDDENHGEDTPGDENPSNPGNSYLRVNTAGEEDAEGDYILFGFYPQSFVSDSALQSTLESFAGILPTSDDTQSWTSYGYYISGVVSDYMWYRDVTYNNDRYRAVYFTSYRPHDTNSRSSANATDQDDNGYTTGTVYWFKYEPIKWRILDEQGGKAFLLCEMLIDSQEYYHKWSSYRTIDGSTVYHNNYEYSNIRTWLNDNFYNTAFNDLQKQLIQLTAVDNSAASTTDAGENITQATGYACRDTEDFIFLLSEKEVTTAAYGFTSYDTADVACQKQTTDYALCQGASTYSGDGYDGCGYWWLRSPYYIYSNGARIVGSGGYASSYNYVDRVTFGVCPALWIAL